MDRVSRRPTLSLLNERIPWERLRRAMAHKGEDATLTTQAFITFSQLGFNSITLILPDTSFTNDTPMCPHQKCLDSKKYKAELLAVLGIEPRPPPLADFYQKNGRKCIETHYRPSAAPTIRAGTSFSGRCVSDYTILPKLHL